MFLTGFKSGYQRKPGKMLKMSTEGVNRISSYTNIIDRSGEVLDNIPNIGSSETHRTLKI